VRLPHESVLLLNSSPWAHPALTAFCFLFDPQGFGTAVGINPRLFHLDQPLSPKEK
jgi:hypothetical protein